jgi:DNA polymerase-3 subunit gamma/tau
MDAASHTGVDDIRELIDAAQYRPVQGRYKIYIIDEAHMLSRNAFNALLKTLEEPPAHVKFILATTEIHKIPATILSRCLRFDLGRISEAKLIAHFTQIAAQEGMQIESEAVALVAKLADGSARDGLSMLEQAFNLGVQPITAQHIRQMVGFADLAQLQTLYQQLLGGDLNAAMITLAHLYQSGADAVALVHNLMELTHGLLVTVGTKGAYTPMGYEAAWCQEIAQKASVPILNRFWQILLKGAEEISHAPSARMALEVIFVRLAYVHDQPTIDQMLKSGAKEPSENPQPSGGGGGHAGGSPRVVASPVPVTYGATAIAVAPTVTDAETGLVLKTFEQLLEFVAERREPLLYTHLIHDVHLIQYQPGRLEVRLSETAPADFVPKLQSFLRETTQHPWLIILGQELGLPTQAEQRLAAREAVVAHYEQQAEVRAVQEVFPGARVISITRGTEKIK